MLISAMFLVLFLMFIYVDILCRTHVLWWIIELASICLVFFNYFPQPIIIIISNSLRNYI